MEHSGKQLSVVWRGRNFLLVMDECAKLKDLGETLQKLTNVQIDTLRLIVPEKKGSKLLYPFSDEHSNLPLEAVSTIEGKSIRMMGVPENEVEQVLQSVKTDLRIAGFDEEERRLRQRATYNHKSIIQLPQGTYVFSEFRTLSLPGIELNPPASEALKIMHRLAADPGIVAVMNKHRWRVGIMTELAPVGYVGVSPKCILGFNKNQGEEISLRLRTDDLKGFRKYESIKMTLLHELTHMVFSDHDANFLALNSQLNKEATALDWTKSKGHTLNGIGPAMHYEEEYGIDSDVSLSYKLGGQELGFSTARASSVAAAYRRFAETSPNVVRATDASEDLDHVCSLSDVDTEVTDTGCSLKPIQLQMVQENDSLEESKTEGHGFDTSLLASNDPLRMEIDRNPIQHRVSCKEPDPDDSQAVDDNAMFEEILPHQEGTKPHEPMDLPYREPDPDDSQVNVVVEKEPEPKYNRMVIDEMSIDQSNEPDPDDSQVSAVVAKELESGNRMVMDGLSNGQSHEPDPDDSQVSAGAEKALESDNRMVMVGVTNGQSHEPDPDDSQVSAGAEKALESDNRMVMGGVTNGQSHEPDPDDSQASIVVGNEHEPDHSRVTISEGASLIQSDEPDPDDLELQRIQDPAKAIYSQLQKAMDMLRSEVDPLDVAVVLQTLLKIIRNAIEHPTELKFRKVRKANPIIQRNILRYEAAKDMLQLVGFCEDVIIDKVGKSDAYLVLKRNDPGLLWLVRSSLESYNA